MSSKRTPRTRADQKDETRRKLVAAARRVLAARGYEEASVADIAREAGVAHGTLYVHFDGKDAIVGELVADFNARLGAQIAEALAGAEGGSLTATVERAAAAFLAALRADKALVRWAAQHLAPHLGVEALRDGVNPPALAALEAALGALVEARGAKGVAVRPAALGLLALWFRLGLLAVFGPAAEREAIEALLVRMTVGAVEALLAAPVKRGSRKGG